MRRASIFFIALLLLGFTARKTSITDKERKTAAELLSQTEQGVFNSLLGMSDAQLNFKPAPDRWSIADCIKHIAVTEHILWQMTDAALKQSANPDKRNEIKATDEQVVQMIESRAKKVKTAPSMEPQNTSYKSTADALASFREAREKLIHFINTTDADLRNHVVTFSAGSYDCYQMVLFIAAHSNRHTQQMEEVKGDPNFPKN
ncbi:MAG TPA: DinB family protein [Chitinophagaceae bacterium]|nr:DinB family protein [Chitinophagaceae bacterium]